MSKSLFLSPKKNKELGDTMITKLDITEQERLLQNDIESILDGIDDEMIMDKIRQVISDRFEILIDIVN